MPLVGRNRCRGGAVAVATAVAKVVVFDARLPEDRVSLTVRGRRLGSGGGDGDRDDDIATVVVAMRQFFGFMYSGFVAAIGGEISSASIYATLLDGDDNGGTIDVDGRTQSIGSSVGATTVC